MEVHIGSLIKARTKSLRIGPTELGSKIETSKQNVYGIFKRQSIDTDLLYRISLALSHDFFQYLSLSLQKSDIGTDARIVDGEHTHQSSRLAELGRENAYLRRLNGLLEEKLAHVQSEAELVKRH